MAKNTNRLRFGEAIGSEASLGRNAARRQMEAAERSRWQSMTQASASERAADQRDRIIAQNDRMIELLEYVADQMYRRGGGAQSGE